MAKSTKTTGVKKATAKAEKRPQVKVTLFVNEYDVPMLEIGTAPRSTYISVKKAVAILATKDNSDLKQSVQKYGRDLFRIDYGDGKGFTAGENKINAVLNNAGNVEKAIA